MYEGKNIHYSRIDQKPLCSFSGKVCNQRRLNKYGFCVRHILEDPEAPFKRCAYVAKSSKQTCTQPIPRSEERLYCNNHMQVMGMLPKKERKPKKEKDKIIQTSLYHGRLEPQELFQSPVRSRLAVDSQITAGSQDDLEDVYAFPTDPGEGSGKLNHVSTIVASVGGTDSSHGVAKSVSFLPHKPAGESSSSGSSSLAKIYPELAEKLEKIKPKIETKVKGKSKSSRTMNSLQTKIAQNKIKDKLKRNHESSASSQSQSPSSSFNSANSPGFHLASGSPSVQTESTENLVVSNTKFVSLTEDRNVKEKVTSSVAQPSDSVQLSREPSSSITSVPGLPQLNQLNALSFPSLNLSLGPFGLPLPTASDVEETLKHLGKVTPVPVPGAVLTPEGAAAGLIPGLPLAGTLIPTDFLTLHHLLRPSLGPQSGPPPPYPGTQNKTSVMTKAEVIPPPSESVAVTQEKIVNHAKPVTAEQSTQFKQTETSESKSSVFSSVNASATASLQGPLKQAESFKCSTVLSKILPQNSTKSSKSRTSRSKFSPVSKTLPPVTLLSLSVTLTKPRKVKNVLSETSLNKLKTNSAIKYYRTHKKRKLNNHNLLVSELLDSDSDTSDCDMLPWQPHWFSASSDEDQGDEEEDQSFDLRTTKLALSRARLRRKCFQSRKSYCANFTVQDQDSKYISALISAARENPRVAAWCVRDVTGSRPKLVNKYKRRGLEKRKCCYKNDDDVRCQNFVVPYTNHCSRHVMYNVDQLLFEYCTAKFADNTQCCVPVIDLKHELPLCMEHGIKADNYQKLQDSEPKPKRPRKKTKPSALTRPSRKGKKKKSKKKATRPQKSLPPSLPTVDTDHGDTEEDVLSPSHDDDDDKTEDEDYSPSKMACLKSTTSGVQPVPQPVLPLARRLSPPKVHDKLQKVSSLEELDNLGGLQELENEKMFGELPLETASRLLEENDFQEVLNRLPDETFDLFTNKNGMFEPTNEEVEELEKSIAMVNKDLKSAKDSFEQISTSQSVLLDTTSQSTIPPVLDSTSQSSLPPILDDADELTKQIAEEILSQNLGSAISSQNINTADAQESIKAIARSLSTSGQFLAPQISESSESDRFLMNSFQKRTFTLGSMGNQAFLRKDSAPDVQSQTQSAGIHPLTQFSSSVDRNNVPVSSVHTTPSLSLASSPCLPLATNAVTSNNSLKFFHGDSVSTTTDSRLLSQAQSENPVSLPSNLPLTQQQLLQLMTVRQQMPVQYQSFPTSSQRPPTHMTQITPITLTPQLTAEQLLEKQQLIQQQKQQLEVQQQQLLRQQQQLEALTQQQQTGPQLLQPNILLQPPSVPVLNKSTEQPVSLAIHPQAVSQPLQVQPQMVSHGQTQSVLSQPLQTQPLVISQPLVVSSSMSMETSGTQVTPTSLPQYVAALPQLSLLSQEPKTNPVLQTAQLFELQQLQQQLALFAQHQQLLLQQQLVNMNQQNLSPQSQQNLNQKIQQNLSQPNQLTLSQQNQLNFSQQTLDQQTQQNLNPPIMSSLSQYSVTLNQQTVSVPNSESVSSQNQSVLSQSPQGVSSQSKSSKNVQSVSGQIQDRVQKLHWQNVPYSNTGFLNISQQTNLNQPTISNLNFASNKNKSVLVHGQPLTMPKQQSATQTPLSQTFSIGQTRTAIDSVSNKFVTSHVPTMQEAKVINVASSKPQATQYHPPKQEIASGKLADTNIEKSGTKKIQKHNVKTSKASSKGSSPSTVSQSIISSESSLLANIDTSTMTTKALEQHIVQMAYQQALAKQNEDELERSKNPKKVGGKKTSQKGTKRNNGGRNAAGVKKTKEVLKTPEMLRRQSELEEQLAQLAKQNMTQKQAFQQKALTKLPVSQPSVEANVFKHVSVPTTTIAWKPVSNVQKYPNGIPENTMLTSVVPAGNDSHNSVNLSSTGNLSLTTTSQTSTRPITKHLGPPPSYNQTMTANLIKSSSAPS